MIKGYTFIYTHVRLVQCNNVQLAIHLDSLWCLVPILGIPLTTP